MAEPTPVRTPRSRAADIACVAGVFTPSAQFYLTLPFTGYLLVRPLLNLVLNPGTVALATAGAFARVGDEPVWAVIVLGTLGLCLFDPFAWWAGHRLGDKFARRLIPSDNLVNRIERFVDHWGTWALVFAYYVPIPVLMIQLTAGASGMKLRRFIAADLLGTLLWVLLIEGLGYAAGKPAVKIVRRFSHDLSHVSYALVAVAIILAGLRGRRQARG